MRSQLALLGSLVFLAISALGTALPAEDAGLRVLDSGSNRCTKPLVRKEWSVSPILSAFAFVANH